MYIEIQIAHGICWGSIKSKNRIPFIFRNSKQGRRNRAYIKITIIHNKYREVGIHKIVRNFRKGKSFLAWEMENVEQMIRDFQCTLKNKEGLKVKMKIIREQREVKTLEKMKTVCCNYHVHLCKVLTWLCSFNIEYQLCPYCQDSFPGVSTTRSRAASKFF